MPLGGLAEGLLSGLDYNLRAQQAQQQQQQQQLMMRRALMQMAQEQRKQQVLSLLGGQASGLFGQPPDQSGAGGGMVPQQPQPQQSTQLPQVPPAAAQMQSPLLGLIKQDESGGRNINNFRFDPTHTAGGLYQITDSTWNRYAPQVGAPKLSYPLSPKDRPEEEQTKVADTILRNDGAGPWANYNPKLAADLKSQAKLSPEQQGQASTTAVQAAGMLPPQMVGNAQPGILAQLVQRIAGANAPNDVKGAALVELLPLMSQEGQRQFTQQLELAKFASGESDKAQARGERAREFDIRERDVEANREFNRLLATGKLQQGQQRIEQSERKTQLAEQKQTDKQAGQTQFSEADVDYWANVLKSGGHLPPGLARTAAGSQFVQRLMAKIPSLSNKDPGAFIENTATVKADDRSLSNMTRMADAATSFERTASQNFDLALQLSKDAVPTDWGPWLNKWIESGETQAGNTDVPPYVTAMLTAANEYAKIMSGSTGAQGSTVDSRREAAELFSPYLSQGQIQRVVGIAKADMANRKQSLYGQIDDIKARLHSAGSGEPTATQGQKPQSGAPAAPQGGKYTVGQVIEKGGKRYRVTGGDLNSDPNVEPVP